MDRRDLRKAAAADLNPAWSRLREVRGLIRRFRLHARAGFRRPEADLLAHRITAAVAAGDRQAALAIATTWAARAEATGDRGLLERVGFDMRRLGRMERASALLAQAKRRDGPKEWDGRDLGGRRLLVERRDGDLAQFFLFLSPIGLALDGGMTCIIPVEQRLVPLFRRTLPGADVRSESSGGEPAAEADRVTSLEGLAHHLAWDGVQCRRTLPDPRTTRAFRLGYAGAPGRPLVGISWGSLNLYKDTPAIGDWVRLIERAPAARFVSLQYGNVESTIRAFETRVPGRVLVDMTVDQISDMDRFAAQVAALDAVVTISSTVAHLAGAIGVPTLVLLDGAFRRSWPGFGADVPWYQSVHLVRKSASGWRDTIDEAGRWLASRLRDPTRDRATGSRA